jgi:Lrp/AsnC family transcriptional regulator
MSIKSLDSIDQKILAILQKDAETPINALAEAVDLSATPCWRRIQRLKDSGVIKRQVALLNSKALNLNVTVFVSIKTNQHNQAWLDRFKVAVEQIPEIVEFYRMSGDVDYLLRVVVPSIDAYDGVYKKLIRGTDLFDVSSSFAMEEIKLTTELPLNYVISRP